MLWLLAMWMLLVILVHLLLHLVLDLVKEAHIICIDMQYSGRMRQVFAET